MPTRRAYRLSWPSSASPGYAPRQPAAVLGKLADEAGLRLTVAARGKAVAVIEQAERDQGPGNARLAVRLLNEARAAQAQRVARGPASVRDLAALVTITEADIPEFLLPHLYLSGDVPDVRGARTCDPAGRRYRTGAGVRSRPGSGSEAT